MIDINKFIEDIKKDIEELKEDLNNVKNGVSARTLIQSINSRRERVIELQEKYMK